MPSNLTSFDSVPTIFDPLTGFRHTLSKQSAIGLRIMKWDKSFLTYFALQSLCCYH